MELAVNFLQFFIILSIGLVFTNNRDMYRTDHSPNCSPVHAVIVWDTNTDELDMKFVYHKRFLYALIRNMAEDSYIVLKTTGDLNTELEFKKDLNWVETLTEIEFSISETAIPYSLLRKSVESALGRHETADMDIQLFLLVNDISRLDNEEKAVEALTIVNTFVVFTGKIQPQKVWTDLASDENHVYISDNIDGKKIPQELENFLDLSCQNSRPDHGISMYLKKSRCYKCVYLCGRIKNNLPQFCLNTCPNFHCHLDMSKDCQNNCAKQMFMLVIGLFTVIVMIFGVPLMLGMSKYFEGPKVHPGENENTSKQ